ncbi:hypothetical protein OIE61_21770 [Streptomyces sp. NBC_01762]|nr:MULTISPECIES: hypothetical protein [unclassified Streptomyces]WSC38241.1 hypothetical protein OHA08_23615 [Streptomyces sp. NBC_01763]WSC46359.1 hypothetical protein OIE61_21770 [Streptomyces sp. NBC_01762]WSD26012.1 hypothetical protein OHA26_22460 [Streptomyces sp. NBC_01751]
MPNRRREKPYTVRVSYMVEVLAETTIAEEAVAEAVRHLSQAAD